MGLKYDALDCESLCRRCGSCCGAGSSDPCSNLLKEPDGRYKCAVYDSRFGIRRSRSGRTFMCLTIRDVLKYGVTHEGCGYER